MSLMNRAARLALAVLLASWFAPPASANPVDDLLERIDAGASRKFVTVLRPSTADYFELSQQGSRVRVEGNTWVNIAAGIHWYLKHYAGVLITWNNMHPRLPRRMPAVPHTERHVTPLARRYYFNYCTFSYSMAFWDWNRWQEEIDWMALHGINMPLAATGEEVAWRNMLLRLGYTNDEVGRFIAGPAFLAWWAMNNLEGWGGPLPDSWYARQEALQKKILRRERALGMHPVLPGYSGMLPHDAKEKLGVNVTPGGLWNGYTRPATVAATDPAFDRIADLYYQELTKLYGRADYYSMDPFHESADNDRVDYAACGRKLMAAMKRANANAVWVVQGWTENPRPEMADSLPGRDLLVLDLFSECRPMFGAPSVWRRDKGYGDHPWLFCMLENFGANVGLHGRMDQLIHNFALAASRTTPLRPARSHLDGWGLTMEGIQNNPVMFELMSELPWMCDSLPADNNLAAFRRRWLNDYVFARYGTSMPALRRAWQILGASIYNCPLGNNQQGPHESIFDGRPSLDNFQVKSWSKMHNYYDPDDTYRAACLMTDVADSLSGNNNFEYDLVDVVRQALDDQARLLYLHVVADYKGFDRKAFSADSARFLHALLLQDSLLGTRREFRLGHWTHAARALGGTQQEKDLYEWNARVQITTWGNRLCADRGGLRDYAHKEWQGLLRDFYFVRWHTYLDALSRQMARDSRPDPDALGQGANAGKTATELFAMAMPKGPDIDWYALEEPWTLRHNDYSPQPQGSCIYMARRVMAFLRKN